MPAEAEMGKFIYNLSFFYINKFLATRSHSNLLENSFSSQGSGGPWSTSIRKEHKCIELLEACTKTTLTHNMGLLTHAVLLANFSRKTTFSNFFCSLYFHVINFDAIEAILSHLFYLIGNRMTKISRWRHIE